MAVDLEMIWHCRIIRPLGGGRMGEVYLAQDTKLDRKVAIKFLPRKASQDEKAKQRLAPEAQVAASLDHPNICPIHEQIEENTYSLILMQYVEGETLWVRMQNKRLTLSESLGMVIQVADPLA